MANMASLCLLSRELAGQANSPASLLSAYEQLDMSETIVSFVTDIQTVFVL